MKLYEQFLSIDLKVIRDYVDNKKEENLQLEFKTIKNPNLTNNDDKKNFAKALSGFANSSGGILIWGIETNKKDGIDCASEISEIQKITLFLTKLNSFTGEFVSPIVEGVQHEIIFTSQDEDRGLIKSYFPESDSGPHMAKVKEYRYFKRSGDSFYKMEHFDIEDMFGRRKKPRLSIFDFFSIQKYNASSLSIYLIISIKNDGRTIAKHPYLEIKVHKPNRLFQYGIDGNGTTGLDRMPHTQGDKFSKFGSLNNQII